MTDIEFDLICAPVTPFTSDGDLDEVSIAGTFSFLRRAGIRRVLTPGTTGEFTTLSDVERAKVVEVALDTFGPAGVIAHVGAADGRHASSLARDALLAGAEQFSAITPYFFPAGPSAIVDYYEILRGTVGERRLLAYTFPQRTGITVTPDTLRQLAERHIVDGIKISGVATAELPSFLHVAPSGFPVYSGNDVDTFELAQMGAQGVVSGVSSIFPEPFVEALAIINDGGDRGELPELIRSAVVATAHGDLRVMKLAGEARSLMHHHVRAVLDPVTKDEQEALSACLSSYGTN